MSKPYLHGHHASVLRSHTWRTVENSCPYLIPHLDNPALKIFDVGCGPGTITVDLASRVPEGFVYGIDPSADVIEKARKHAEEKGVTNVRFEVGDVFDWDHLDGVEAGGFDIVHAHQVLQHLQDPVGATRQMKRLTKEHGIIAVREVDYSAITWYPDFPGLHEWLDTYIKVAKDIKCDPNIGKRIHAVAMEAGFKRTDIETSGAVWVYSSPGEIEWWCGSWADRALYSDFATQCLEKGIATKEDLERISETWKEFGKKEDAWIMIPHGQIICHVGSR